MSKVTILKKNIQHAIVYFPINKYEQPTVDFIFSYTTEENNDFTVEISINDIILTDLTTDNILIDKVNNMLYIHIPHEKFSLGTNTVLITIIDVVTEGTIPTNNDKYKFSYLIYAEDRTSSYIIRNFTANGDILTSGDVSIDTTKGLTLLGENDVVKTGIAIMTTSINMAGHNKIDSITLIGQDADYSTTKNFVLRPAQRENLGAYICDSFRLNDLKKYTNITGINLVDI